MEDNLIVSLFWERQPDAIAQAAEKYGAYATVIAYRILADSEDVEECVNDAYLGLWNAIPPHRPKNLQTFFGKIVRNLALNRYKQLGAKKRAANRTAVVLSELEECIPAPETVEHRVDECILAESINRFLTQLPESKRNIFICRYWHLYSVRDIAAWYGISESKTASLLFQIRKKLKLYLEQEGVLE